MNWSLSVLKPLFKWLLSEVAKKLWNAIGRYPIEKRKQKQREATAKEQAKSVIESGSNPELTKEERINEQKSSWRRFVDWFGSY